MAYTYQAGFLPYTLNTHTTALFWYFWGMGRLPDCRCAFNNNHERIFEERDEWGVKH
jgi:hypothetical protein